MIESVPNISEGSRQATLAAVRDAIRKTGGATLLDDSADPSHNRSVFTLVGDAMSLRAAILEVFRVVVARIDLRTHHGVHPRIGAVDVVPFIPLTLSTMADCVALAREVGSGIAREFEIPVFLYEEAATMPERRRLESIRRGGLEGLAARMRRSGWAPDFGPAMPHPTAGVTAIGARRLLIAYNVNLDSADVSAARAIAAAVRESSGGLPCVKALGLWLEHRGVAQVSMNLTDFTRTSIETAFDAVVREAGARGVPVLESELIGLIPAAALAHTTPERLKLRNFDRSQILEERIKRIVG